MATGRIGVTPVLGTRWSKEPAGGTTSLSGLDDNSVSLVYSVGYEQVYRNGVLLSRGNDYTATDGTSITLTDATITGDIIEVFAQELVPLTDAISKGQFTAKGSLLSASAASTPAVLGVGSNDQVLTADSSTATGLKWAAPSSPSFSGCYLYRTTAQTISNNTNTTVLWDAEEFDVGGYHSTSSNTERITIPTGKGGYYLFTFNIFWNTGADSLRQVEMYKNGSTQVGKFDQSRASSSYGQGVMGSTILSTAANDYFELRVYQDSGNNVDLRQLTFRSFFACTLLGA